MIWFKFAYGSKHQPSHHWYQCIEPMMCQPVSLVPGSGVAVRLPWTLRCPPCPSRSSRPGTAVALKWAGRKTGRQRSTGPGLGPAGCPSPPCQRSAPRSGAVLPTATTSKFILGFLFQWLSIKRLFIRGQHIDNTQTNIQKYAKDKSYA